MPTITFNSSTGSDTAASGSSAPAVALTGTNASFAASVVTLDGSPDLSAFSATTWVLWLKTSTGRQFFDLSSADNTAKTVTCVNAPSGTFTGLTWGIGGKRATLEHADSRTLFNSNGWKKDWIVETETNQSLTTALQISGVAGAVLRGASGAKRTIVQTTNTYNIETITTNLTIENLALTNSAVAPKTSAVGVRTSVSITWRAVDCIFGDATNQLQLACSHGSGNPTAVMIDCEVKNCISEGVSMPIGTAICFGCWIHNNGGNGARFYQQGRFYNCIINGNSGDGIKSDSAAAEIINCTIHGNTGDGIDLIANAYAGTMILGSQITGNGNFGIRNATSYVTGMLSDFNNFGTGGTANTSGARSNVLTGSNDLAVDPGYTNAGSNDFSIGTNTKAEGWPDAARYIGANQSATRSYVDIGAAQRQEAGGSGAVPRFGAHGDGPSFRGTGIR